ncbi:MAG TPA: hypothetical protein VFE62_01275 [Gemmataceae bacterium]|nr:hypothetical protein [Gemmataceae bacterium]
MDTVELTVCIAIAVVLVGVAAFFFVRQRQTLQSVHADASMSEEQRRYLLTQARRRIAGSVLLLILAGMLVGSLFFDYEPLRTKIHELPAEQQEAAKYAVRVFGVYWMAFLFVLLALMALAVFDFWATARFSVQQQRQLFQQHQDMLEAELTEHRYRQDNSNGAPH